MSTHPLSAPARAAEALGAATPTGTLLDRVAALRESLKPAPDPELADALTCARAQLDPAFARALEREHAYDPNRGRRSALDAPGLTAVERKRCEHCYGFVSHAFAGCEGCGHRPDPAIGHRQTARTERQQQQARRARAQRKRQRSGR